MRKISVSFLGWLLGGILGAQVGEEDLLGRSGRMINQGEALVAPGYLDENGFGPQPDLPLPTRTEEEVEAMRSGRLVPGSSLMGALALKELWSESGERVIPDKEALELIEEESTRKWPDEIENQYYEAYFRQRPSAFLIDPQSLLPPDERARVLALLEKHGRASVIDLYVYLFTAKQELPPEESVYSVLRTVFGGVRGDRAVAFYFLGRPERTELVFSSRVYRGIDDREIRKILQMLREAAGNEADLMNQLEGFIKEATKQFYGVEGRLPPELDTLMDASSVEEAEEEPLFSPAMMEFLMTCGLLAGILLTVASGWWIWERRRTFTFPDAEGEPVLDAPHAAGVGAVLSYANGSLPPSVQEPAKRDYLHHL